MSRPRTPAVAAAIEALYAACAAYPRPAAASFCTFCYSEEKVAALTSTALPALDCELARCLLWETGDHWGSADDYRHYLPRILEARAPPESCEDLYPEHLFEVLAYHHVEGWPARERDLVHRFLVAVTDDVVLDAEDAVTWRAAVAALAVT